MEFVGRVSGSRISLSWQKPNIHTSQSDDFVAADGERTRLSSRPGTAQGVSDSTLLHRCQGRMVFLSGKCCWCYYQSVTISPSLSVRHPPVKEEDANPLLYNVHFLKDEDTGSVSFNWPEISGVNLS